LLAILGSLWLFIRSTAKKPVEVAATAPETTRFEEAPVQITDTRPVVTTAAVLDAAVEPEEDILPAEQPFDIQETPAQDEIAWALEEESKDENQAPAGIGPAVLVGAGVLVAEALSDDQAAPEETEAEGVAEDAEPVELVESEGSSAEALVAAKLAADEWGSEEPAVEAEAQEAEALEEQGGEETAVDLEAMPEMTESSETEQTQTAEEPPVLERAVEIELADVQKRLLNHDVEYMEGIGPAYGAKLKVLGIATALDLLRQGATRRGRADLVEKSGISQKLILKWINQADMYRIKGIGSEYAELLEAAGVDTVVELAARRPENLHPALQEANELKNLTRQVPSLTQVKDWIEQAKELPRVIRY
jgi:predicted flap endonuclease-1-like 5' DNA nuclease